MKTQQGTSLCLQCQKSFTKQHAQHVICNAMCWGGVIREFQAKNSGRSSFDTMHVIEWLRGKNR